jgi:thiol:disulfide interchange protein
VAAPGRRATPARAGVSPALQAALNAANAQHRSPAHRPAQPIGTFAALLGALLGGLMLNLMPCVFPVLAIKVVGFTRHADDARATAWRPRVHAGVVVSFLALGGADAGRCAPPASNWAGASSCSRRRGGGAGGAVHADRAEPRRRVRVRFLLPSVASLGWQARHPVANAFLSGVLAVAIASPCTAPFMGASLGLAISLPAARRWRSSRCWAWAWPCPTWRPAWCPAVARALPRPGAWMDTFRKLMAFPMFATVAWLVWVLGQQSGIDGAGALLALLVALSMVVWALTLRGRTRVVLAALAVAGWRLLAWSIGANITRPQPASPRPRRAAGAGSPGSRAGSTSCWPPASRCSSTSPRPGA